MAPLHNRKRLLDALSLTIGNLENFNLSQESANSRCLCGYVYFIGVWHSCVMPIGEYHNLREVSALFARSTEMGLRLWDERQVRLSRFLFPIINADVESPQARKKYETSFTKASAHPPGQHRHRLDGNRRS